MMTLSNMILLRQRRLVRGRRAFTLVELMVAVALVLVLIIGVNEVFRLTSNTINVGQLLSASTRDQRAARTVLEDDFKHMAADAPCLIITNKAVAAYRSKEEELADVGLKDETGGLVGAPTPTPDPLRQDLNGDGFALRPDSGSPPTGATFVPGEYASPATPTAVGSRIRRVDTITFFERRPGMRRQTANYSTAALVSNAPRALDVIGSTVASEAMVTYGHLRLPDNASVPGTAVYFEPGEPDGPLTGNKRGKRNDNNRYYTQWVLGRSAVLMQPRANMLAGETYFDKIPPGTALNLTPLSHRTNVGGGHAILRGGTAMVTDFDRSPADSLIDVADTNIADFSQALSDYVRDVAAAPLNYPIGVNSGRWYLPAVSTSYFDTDTIAAGVPHETLSYRANGNPFGPRGFTGARNDLALLLAETAPVLLPRCTNFIVEYAGDFITQNANPGVVGGAKNAQYGLATSAEPDGEVDFTVFRGARKIRWYGLPRYDNSGNVLQPTNASITYSGPVVRGRTGSLALGVTNIVRGESDLNDADNSRNVSEVVPLSDLLTATTGGATRTVDTIASFEKVLMTDRVIERTQPAPATTDLRFYDLDETVVDVVARQGVLRCLPPQLNYADTSVGVSAANQFMLARANYVCAWQGSDRRPKLIRIIMTLEAPNSRAGDGGQTYEYIFPVPQ